MALEETNISLNTVKTTLGSSAYDLSGICTSSNINMWAKRKPVRDNRLEIPLADVGKTQVGAASGQWGIALYPYDGDDTIISTYLQPRGYSSEPFRLGDFRNYNHTPEPPIDIPPQPLSLPASDIHISMISQDPNPYSLTLMDFGLRMGVYVYYHDSGLYIGSATAQYDGGTSISITFDAESDTPVLPGSYVDVCFCMARYYKPWTDAGGITGAYEPFRSPFRVAGQVMTGNPNWTNVLVTGTTGNPAITHFNITHQPDLGKIDIEVETRIYTGDLFVRITHIENGNMTLDDNINLNITVTDTVVHFAHMDISWIVPGRTYQAMIWMGNTIEGARDGECEFVALLES